MIRTRCGNAEDSTHGEVRVATRMVRPLAMIDAYQVATRNSLVTGLGRLNPLRPVPVAKITRRHLLERRLRDDEKTM